MAAKGRFRSTCRHLALKESASSCVPLLKCKFMYIGVYGKNITTWNGKICTFYVHETLMYSLAATTVVADVISSGVMEKLSSLRPSGLNAFSGVFSRSCIYVKFGLSDILCDRVNNSEYVKSLKFIE